MRLAVIGGDKGHGLKNGRILLFNGDGVLIKVRIEKASYQRKKKR